MPNELPEGCPACGALPCDWAGGADPHKFCSTPADLCGGEVVAADKAAAARYLAGAAFGVSVKDYLAAWAEAEKSEDGYCHPLWIVLRDHRIAALYAKPQKPAAITPKGDGDDLSRNDLVDLDHARFALFDAIGKIKIGNPTDDKLILDNLREAGFWICHIDAAALSSRSATVVDRQPNTNIVVSHETPIDVTQADRITELEARVKALDLDLEAAQCLMDSQYNAGVKLGWHLCATDDEAGYQRVTSGTEHIAELRRIQSERAALNPSARSE